VRTTTLRVLQVDGELEALRMLTDRREALTRRRVQTVNRLQALLAELLPGQAKRDITTLQAKVMLASVRPRDIAGKTRRCIAAEELAELVAVEAKIKKATAELKVMVLARDSHLMDLRGVGPVVAARALADVGDVARAAPATSPGNRFRSQASGSPPPACRRGCPTPLVRERSADGVTGRRTWGRDAALDVGCRWRMLRVDGSFRGVAVDVEHDERAVLEHVLDVGASPALSCCLDQGLAFVRVGDH